MAISFNTIPANLRLPLFYAEVDNSQASFFQRQQRALLIGQKLSAGSATAGEPVQVSSEAMAKSLFGQGSMLAAMMRLYRANDNFGEVWCLPVDDAGAGVAATKTVTVSGSASAAGTVSLYVAGRRVQAGVDNGAAATAVAAAIAASVAAAPDLPVTAGAAAGVVTLTARHKGALGNDIDVRLNYRGALGGETTPAGLTIAVADGATGTGDPDIGTALAALGDEEYDFVACAYTDTTNLDAIKDEWDDQTGRWSWSRQVYGHVFAAHVATQAGLTTFGNARNDPHVSVLGVHASPTPPWEWAAAFCATAAVALGIDPARSLQTLALSGVLPPVPSARFTAQERQTLLFDGVATYTVGVDATVRLERSITTYQTNAFGQPDPSYLDVQTLATLATILRRLRAAITQKFGRHKLADDGTRFGAGQAIVTPRIIRAELIAQYRQMETLALVENGEAFAANLLVERNIDDPNRVDVLFPPDLVNQLRVFAVLAQFRLQYPADAA